MATTVVKTIKPAGGGDYTSLNDFESSERQDLTSTDVILVAEIYGGGNCLTGPVTFSAANWTTDNTRYIIVRAASSAKHIGVYDTNKAYGETALTSTGALLEVGVDYFRVDGMQFRKTDINTGSRWVIRMTASGGNSRFIVERCILINTGNNESVMRLFGGGISDGSHVVKNNAILNRGGNLGFEGQGTFANPSDIRLYNNTIIGGVLVNSGTLTTNNNYIRKSTNLGLCYNTGAGFTLNTGNNDATDTGESPNPVLQNIPYNTNIFRSTTNGDEDLRLITGSALIDSGATLDATVFPGDELFRVLRDFNGHPRPLQDVYDIGANEWPLPPVADWSAEVTTDPDPTDIVQVDADIYGQAPLSVEFTDLSENFPEEWLWDFGDGTTGSETIQQNPTHSYTAPGLYTVKLTVENVNGSDDKQTINVIRATDGQFLGVTEADPEGD